MEYIRRLKLCIKWFQELEGNYLIEQEKLLNALESAKQKCNELGTTDFFCFIMFFFNMLSDVNIFV